MKKVTLKNEYESPVLQLINLCPEASVFAGSGIDSGIHLNEMDQVDEYDFWATYNENK